MPTLIIHGDDDQIVPIGASALKSSKLVNGATLKVYPGAPMACSPPTRTSSTPTCSTFSGPEPDAAVARPYGARQMKATGVASLASR